ncbi:MAG: SGNH/GDSL hydrolase family protein [Vicinamibacterales bacterium]
MGVSNSDSRHTGVVWPFVVVGSVLIVSALVANEWVLGTWLTRVGRVTNPTSRVLIGLFDVTALGVGLLLLVRRDKAPWRQLLLAGAAVVFAAGLAEATPRLWFSVSAWLAPPDRVIATGIGWRPVENVSMDREVPGFGRVRYHTVHGGFRLFGDPHTSKLKVLAIGDSFTEAVMVSDGEAYYHRLAAARPDLEVFAIGAGGFGTLQEYMLLDQVVDTVRPDLILLQMHPNDLINNSHALESRSTTNNNQMTRPYWEQGKIVPRFPENREWGAVYRLVRHSYILRLLNANLLFFRSRSADSIERTLRAGDPDVARATDTTVELLTMIRRRANVPVVAFSVRSEEYFSFWSRADICRRAGVRFIPGVGEAVDAAADAGEPVTGAPLDAHWNGHGHEIAARLIDAWLKREGLPSR